MLVRATRTVSTWAMRGLFYAGLFVVVAVVQVAVTTALRREGWSPGLALFASGAAVLGLVLLLVRVSEFIRERFAAHRELMRMRQGLPAGACCLVWRPGEGEADMPWELVGQPRARYPKLARRLGIEGIAIVDFEVSADGSAKNIHCVDAWPSDVFFDAAREAMRQARFEPRDDVHPRFGASFRMPFVFRISGASKLKQRSRRALPLRPGLSAAQQAVEKLERSA